MVLRRLRRLCAHYGASPVFVVASATIANPAQHAATLLGVDSVALVDDDGSPAGAKEFVLWNPPLSFPDESASCGQVCGQGHPGALLPPAEDCTASYTCAAATHCLLHCCPNHNTSYVGVILLS
eukprot:350350-Chlamydomonas_euryale.AAC.2